MNRNSNVSQLKQLKTKPNNSAESPTSYHSLRNNRPENPQLSQSQTSSQSQISSRSQILSQSQTSLSPITVSTHSQPSLSTTNNKYGVGSSCGQHQSILPQIPSLQENANSPRLSTLPLPNSQPNIGPGDYIPLPEDNVLAKVNDALPPQGHPSLVSYGSNNIVPISDPVYHAPCISYDQSSTTSSIIEATKMLDDPFFTSSKKEALTKADRMA
jgi:hypothetical protein